MECIRICVQRRIIKAYVAKVENQKIKLLRSNRGEEYKFIDFCA